jgi:hypothetical protein
VARILAAKTGDRFADITVHPEVSPIVFHRSMFRRLVS